MTPPIYKAVYRGDSSIHDYIVPLKIKRLVHLKITRFEKDNYVWVQHVNFPLYCILRFFRYLPPNHQEGTKSLVFFLVFTTGENPTGFRDEVKISLGSGSGKPLPQQLESYRNNDAFNHQVLVCEHFHDLEKITPEKSVFPLKKNRNSGRFSFFVSVLTTAALLPPFNGSRLQVRFPNLFNGEDSSCRWTPGHPPLEPVVVESIFHRFFASFFFQSKKRVVWFFRKDFCPGFLSFFLFTIVVFF